MDQRETALGILRDITEKGMFYDKALAAHEGKTEDKKFVVRLVKGTLERIVEADYNLSRFSRQDIRKLSPCLLSILRLGFYQIRYMDSVPDYAAVNSSVAMAKKHGFSRQGGYVNAVLRNVSREKEPACPDKCADPDGFLSVKYSCPAWLVKRFIQDFGRERAESILSAFLKDDARLSMRVAVSKISRDEIIKKINSAQDADKKLKAEANPLVPCGIFVSGFDDIHKIPGFLEGELYIQDTSSMAAVLAADVRGGERVIDVCAAPGGKAVFMAERVGAGGSVEARDISEKKTEIIRENALRMGQKNVAARAFDAREEDPENAGKADIVICDLPCSGLGTIRHKPDIKLHASEEGIKSLAALQREILSASAPLVAGGGQLIYSTCSITHEECSENAEWFLHKFPEFEKAYERLYLPDEGVDGFFVTKFVKNGQ